MAVVASYKGLYVPYAEVPSDIMDEWEATLKGERTRILSALQAKIADETAFLNRIATPAYNAWQNFIDSEYPDADLIKLKMKIKLKGAYDAWSEGITNAFAEGGTFETNVTNKKAKFGKAKYTLGAVGVKYLNGWETAYKAIGMITGDNRVPVYFDADDTVSGSPVDVFPAGVGRFARAIGVPIIVQGLVIAQYAHENGLATERDAVITNVNNKLTNSVLKMVDTSAYPTVTLEIGYDTESDKLYAMSEAETSG